MEIAWTVLGTVVGISIGTGFSASGLTPPDFKLARRSFLLSAILLGGMDIVWHAQTDHSLRWRVLVSGLIGATIFVLLPEGLRWIARRESVANLGQNPAPTSVSEPAPSKSVPNDTNPPEPKLSRPRSKNLATQIPQKAPEVIRAISIVLRFTFSARQGAILKNEDIPISFLSDKQSKLEGPAGTFILTISPSQNVWIQQDNKVVVTSRFVLPPDSDLLGKQPEVLDSMQNLTVIFPLTHLYSQLDSSTFAQVLIRVNDKDWKAGEGALSAKVTKNISITFHLDKMRKL